MSAVAGGLYSQGDADLNGAINQVDLSIWEGVFGAQGLAVQISAAGAVPEPRALVLLIGGMAVFAAVAHRSLFLGAFSTISRPR